MSTRHLALIRHAVAEPKAEDEADFDRQLVEKGRAASRKMGEFLKAQESFRPEIIISSPAPRALETARLVGAPLGFAPDAIREDSRIFEATADDLAALVHGLDPAWHFVALAGHNPGFEEFAAWLLGRRHFDFPKAAVVWLDCGRGPWSKIAESTAELQAFWKPKDLDDA